MPRNVVCHGHSRPIVDLSYSNITPDGYFLASASKDGLPMLRHGESGDWYGTFQGHKGAVWSCVLNAPALLCATGSADFTARIWDACSGTQLHELQHSHIVRTTAFSQQTNKLATGVHGDLHVDVTMHGGMEKVVRIYDLDRLDAAPQTLPAAASGIRCMTFLQDDNALLLCTVDKPSISVYDTRTLQQVQTIETSAAVTSMEVSFDQQHVTTAEGRVVRFFDASSLKQVKEHSLQHAAESATYAPGKKKFAAGGEDMWVRLYDLSTGEEIECNKGHHGPVHAVRFSPTYDSYASGSEDGTIRIWYLEGSSAGAAADGADAA